MAPAVAASTAVALAPGPILEQQAESANSRVSTPSSGRVQPTKLFIGGISRRTTTKQLRDHFCQGGRVLDCVAMRTPDGRPRGFGYVTLDSPAAAEQFLLTPQNIDDRIVDLKLAVPEDNASKVAATRPVFMTDSSVLMPVRNYYPQTTMFYPWTDDTSQYCGSSFGALGMTRMGWQQPGVAVSADPESATLPSSGDASSALPDCVDLLTGAPDHTGQWSGWQASNLVGGYMPTAAKRPLAEVTNIPGYSQSLSGRNLTATVFPPQQSDPKILLPACVAAPNIFSPLTAPSSEPFAIFEDGPVDAALETCSCKEVDEDSDEASTDPGPLSPTGFMDLSPAAPTPEAQDLPSMGSAGHALGECRRCNFFAKGRCQNGYDCEFCHFPHERQKLTRQEKREQRSIRKAEPLKMFESSDIESEAPSQVPLPTTTLMHGPPGLSLPEAPAAKLTEPLLSTDGLHLQAQPTLPASVFRTDVLSTCPVKSPSCLLSTTPLSCTSAASTIVAKEVRTIGTQTDDNFACPHCCERGEGVTGKSDGCQVCSD